jgi:peptidoglycan/LPS O-acetylase OafA/YrhL
MPVATVAFQRQSQLGDDHWHSVLISLLRGLAAIEVTAAHLRAELYPGLRSVVEPSLWFKGLAFFTGFGHHAVLVFFVISGWLVGGSLLDKANQPHAYANYAIDRVSRLWTVLIPTFLATLLIGLGTGAIIPHSMDFSRANDFSALSFVGNLVGVQTVMVPTFGGNVSLWSLANETWYYVMFPLLVGLLAARSRLTRLHCGGALVLLAVVLPGALIGYFLIWLLGAAFSRIRIDCSAGVLVGWTILLMVAAAYYRLTWNLDPFDFHTLGPDLLFSLVFLILLSSLQFKAAPTSKLVRPVAKSGKFFAGFSFSLYVLHVPLIDLFQYVAASYFGVRQLSPHLPLHAAIYFGMLAFLLVGAYLWFRLFESQTYRIRMILKRCLLRPQKHVSVARVSG